MADTSRTLSYLRTSEFQDGQPAGSITPQSMRDLIVTIGARTPIISVTQAEYGADPTGTNDSTTAIQSAITAATGGICLIPVGNFLISSTLTLPSNTTLMGMGYGTHIYTTAGAGFNYVKNPNWSATYSFSTKVDNNLRVEGIFFDYGSLNDGGTHAISFRMAQNVIVRDCYFNGGNDATAMLACINTTVENCYATGLNNCAYDHWDGTQDFTVRKCYCSMVGGNGLLATGVDSTGVLARTTDGGLFEDVEIHGGGVGIYMNAGYTGCIVQNVTVRNIRMYGTAGGVVCDGAGGQHTIENIWWISGGSSGSGDCAVRISTGSNPTTTAPNDCLIDKIHIINSTTTNGNVGLIHLSGLRHQMGAVSCVGAAISGGTLFYFGTNSNNSVLLGPVFADSSSVSNITYGLYQDGGGAFGTNTTISCWDPFNNYFRHQGPAEDNHRTNVDIYTNQGLIFTNQTSGPGSSTGTLTNAPAAGNPAFWVPITVNGTTRHFPVW